ncbi:hypothetical protein E0L19_11280 [Bacillus paralicheniformis]|nr:hypothetical protein [Bacillus paralicheniformis]
MKTVRYSFQIDLFYKVKNASAHRRSVFLVFAAASRLTRRYDRKNTAIPSNLKSTAHDQHIQKHDSKSITAQQMKAARQAVSAAFFLLGLHHMAAPPKETLTPQSADFLRTYCVLISSSVS